MGTAQFGDDRLVTLVEMKTARDVVFADCIGEGVIGRFVRRITVRRVSP